MKVVPVPDIPKRPVYTEPVARYRKVNSLVATPIIENWSDYSCAAPSGWQNHGSIGNNYSGEYREMADWVVPRFRSRQAAGEVFFNPYYKRQLAYNFSGGGYNLTSKTASCAAPLRYTGYMSSQPIVTLLVPRDSTIVTGFNLPAITQALPEYELARVQRLASTAVLSKRGRGDLDIWESLAEYRQTLAMLENPLTQLASLTQRLQRASSFGGTNRQLFLELSSGYVLYRYGILPLINDINGIIKSLTKVTGKRRITSRQQEQFMFSKSISGTGTAGAISATWSNTITDVVTVRAMSLDEAHISMLNNMGLNTKSLLTLPYELMTYSFVADWLFNIGDLIGAHAPAFGYNQLGSCMVTTQATSNVYNVGSAYCNIPAQYTLVTAPFGAIGITRLTSARSELAPAGFATRSDFKFDQPTRLADAIALAGMRLVKVGNFAHNPRPRAPTRRDRQVYDRWYEATRYANS